MDAAKGVTILLVVLHHALGPMLDANLKVQWWVPVDAALDAVRMPTFFLLAGLFAGKVVHAESGVGLWRDRVAKFIYLFALWTVIRVSFFAILAGFRGTPVFPEVLGRLGRLTMGVSPLWFVGALAVFFSVARLTRRVPAGAQVATAGALSVVVLTTRFDPLTAKIWLLVFFLIGCHYGRAVRNGAKRAGFGSLAGGRHVAWLRWIGTRTLPIYLMHVPALVALVSLPPVRTVLSATGLASPILLLSTATASSLAVYALLRRIPGLFDLPVRASTSRSDDNSRSSTETASKAA